MYDIGRVFGQKEVYRMPDLHAKSVGCVIKCHAVSPVMTNDAAAVVSTHPPTGAYTSIAASTMGDETDGKIHDGTYATALSLNKVGFSGYSNMFNKYFVYGAVLSVRCHNRSAHEMMFFINQHYNVDLGTPSIGDIATSASNPTLRELYQMPNIKMRRCMPFTSANVRDGGIVTLKAYMPILQMITDAEDVRELFGSFVGPSSPSKQCFFEFGCVPVESGVPDLGAEPTRDNIYYEYKLDQDVYMFGMDWDDSMHDTEA